MTNAEGMTKPRPRIWRFQPVFGHSSVAFLSSFVIRHLSFGFEVWDFWLSQTLERGLLAKGHRMFDAPSINKPAVAIYSRWAALN
jgi:hypothetical protein